MEEALKTWGEHANCMHVGHGSTQSPNPKGVRQACLTTEPRSPPPIIFISEMFCVLR